MIGTILETTLTSIFEQGDRYGSRRDSVFVGLYRLYIGDGSDQLPPTSYLLKSTIRVNDRLVLDDTEYIHDTPSPNDADVIRRAIEIYDSLNGELAEEEE